MPTPEPRLSLCVIARNEEAQIERCLLSAKPIVDEMVVLDTGSTDRTRELARALGAAVFDWPWRDDFAAARNAALDRAAGDWTLWLDADEALLPESHARVRELVRRPDAQAYFVLRQEAEQDGQIDGFVEMRQLRLWRQDPALRFTGRCHPHMDAALDARGRRTGQRVYDSDVRIRHTGYRAEMLPGKQARAARLLQLELADRPGQIYYEVELGRTWAILGDARGPALLDDVLARVLAAGPNVPPPPITAAVLERCLRADDPHSPQVMAVVLLVERWFPDSVPLLEAAAGALYRRDEFDHAARLLERLVRVVEAGTYDRANAFPGWLLDPAPYLLNLAVCHHRMAHLDEAERWYRRLLARVPGHAGALQNLGVLEEQRRLLAAG